MGRWEVGWVCCRPDVNLFKGICGLALAFMLVLLYCAKPDSALMACSKGAPYCRLLFATALIFNGGHTDAEGGCDQCLAHKP